MKNKALKISVIVLGVAFLGYSAYLFKKAYIDKGFGSEEAEKEILLGYYVVFLGLPNTKINRDKYRNMTIEELKKQMNLQDEVID